MEFNFNSKILATFVHGGYIRIQKACLKATYLIFVPPTFCFCTKKKIIFNFVPNVVTISCQLNASFSYKDLS